MPPPLTSPVFETFVLRQEWAIAVADVLRLACLVMGLALAALYVRAWLGQGIEARARSYPGFQYRMAAIAVFALFACITEYDRLDEPVTILLPLALVALGLALAGIYALPPDRPSVDHADWLKDDSP